MPPPPTRPADAPVIAPPPPRRPGDPGRRPGYAVTVLPEPTPAAAAPETAAPGTPAAGTPVPGARGGHRPGGPSLGRWAGLGRGRHAAAAHHVTVLARDPDLVSVGLRALPPELGEFAVQRRAAAGPGRPGGAAISGSAAAAVAVVAALLNSVRLRGRAPADCAVVVAGAARLPALRPTLVAAGFAAVETWDGPPGEPPPQHPTGHADAVVDLSGCTWELARAARIRPGLVVLTPAPRWALLALPGLIRAVAPGPPMDLGPAVLRACAGALAAAAPPGRALPDPKDPAVALAVARAARGARP